MKSVTVGNKVNFSVKWEPGSQIMKILCGPREITMLHHSYPTKNNRKRSREQHILCTGL